MTPTLESKVLFFKGFSGLEEVHLVPGPTTFETRKLNDTIPARSWKLNFPFGGQEIITVEDQEKAINTMKAYFKGVKSKTEDFKLPKIIVVEK